MTDANSGAATGDGPPMLVAVRRCSEGDVAVIEAREPAGRRYARSTFRQQEAGRCTYLVAWAGPEPVGSGELEYGIPPELKNLHVLPSYRGRGIGTTLIRSAENQARTAGRLRIGVAQDNPAALRLYARLGYLLTGETATYTYDFTGDDGSRGHATETSAHLERTLEPSR